MWVVHKIAGDRFTRVPIDRVESIDSAVHLKVPAETLGLHEIETAPRPHLPRGGHVMRLTDLRDKRVARSMASGWDASTKSTATAAS